MAAMDEDSDPPLATNAPRPVKGAAPVPPKGAAPRPPSKTNAYDGNGWEGLKALFWVVVFLGGLGYGLYAGVIWVKQQFETADSVGQKAVNCYMDTEKNPWRMKECDKLAERADALRQREKAEKFCKDKGLKFKGTIGDQTECEP